jgi:hypothetical protein
MMRGPSRERVGSVSVVVMVEKDPNPSL